MISDPVGSGQVVLSDAVAIEAWNGVLFDRFVRFRDILTAGLGAHGEQGLRLHPPRPGDRALDLGCGFGDTSRRLAELVGPWGDAVGVDAAERFIDAASREAAEWRDTEDADRAGEHHAQAAGPFQRRR